MKEFALLFTRLDQTNKTNEKVAVLEDYFRRAPDADKLWTLALLSHRRPRKQISSTLLRQWAAELTGLPLWLVEESYHTVGDLAEAISLLLPEPQHSADQSLADTVAELKSLGKLTDEEKRERVLATWNSFTQPESLVYIKLMTGNFRIGVSQSLVIRALEEITGMPAATLAHRVTGNWQPEKTTFQQLILESGDRDDLSHPYPFCLAHPLEIILETTAGNLPPDDAAVDVLIPENLSEERYSSTMKSSTKVSADFLGSPADWQAEWKWDGIRAQVIQRNGELFIWSRGEELVTDKFPELHGLKSLLPSGTVLDGEILPFQDNQPLPFAVLQTRLGRKNITPKHLKEAPIVLIAYDILEWEGKDIRNQPLQQRQAILQALVGAINSPRVRLSELIGFDSWVDLARIREQSRINFAEGLMLKRLNSAYQVGRKRGDWWKWKISPLTIDGVLVYAQKGTGRRAELFTDYTFAVWDGDRLVPFTKAYSGLSDQEMRQVDQFIRRNTQDKFGPVRTVKPELVFEIAFEGIQVSSRHKSGVALRFPRILRWRHDKKMGDANKLDDLKELLSVAGKTLSDEGSEV